jgi:hypothetical protein
VWKAKKLSESAGLKQAFMNKIRELAPELVDAIDRPEVIFLEEQSTDSGKNVLYTSALLVEKGVEPKTVLLMTSPVLQLRSAYATWMAQSSFPDATVISFAPFMIDMTKLSDTQLVTTTGFLLGELARLRDYPAKGYTIPIEISEVAQMMSEYAQESLDSAAARADWPDISTVIQDFNFGRTQSFPEEIDLSIGDAFSAPPLIRLALSKFIERVPKLGLRQDASWSLIGHADYVARQFNSINQRESAVILERMLSVFKSKVQSGDRDKDFVFCLQIVSSLGAAFLARDRWKEEGYPQFENFETALTEEGRVEMKVDLPQHVQDYFGSDIINGKFVRVGNLHEAYNPEDWPLVEKLELSRQLTLHMTGIKELPIVRRSNVAGDEWKKPVQDETFTQFLWTYIMNLGFLSPPEPHGPEARPMWREQLNFGSKVSRPRGAFTVLTSA